MVLTVPKLVLSFDFKKAFDTSKRDFNKTIILEDWASLSGVLHEAWVPLQIIWSMLL